MKKHILVTGGAGFIGSHTIVALIEQGYSPILIDDLSNSSGQIVRQIEEITGVEIDAYFMRVQDPRLLDTLKQKYTTIYGAIHFAAFKSVPESIEKPTAYFRNNIDSLCSLIDILNAFGSRRIVFSSSCTVYGEPKKMPVTEEFPVLPALSPYGATKQMGENILEMSCSQDLTGIVLRYFNPIGAHPSGKIGELPLGVPGNLVPYITQTAVGKRKELVVFGTDYSTPDGTCIRDFIHVCDLAEAHIAALEYKIEHPSALTEIFNVGTGQGNSVKEILETFQEVNQVSLSYRFGDRREGDIEKIFADTSKIFSELKWRPKYTVSEALMHAWSWEKFLSESDKFGGDKIEVK